MPLLDALGYSLDDVDWANPLSDHPLNDGLRLCMLGVGPGFGSNKWFDVSGYHNHGTLTNMDPSTDWVGGRHGYALDFDGTNDYVNVPDDTLWNTSSITLGSWVKTSATSIGNVIDRDDTTVKRQFQFRINSAGKVHFIPFFGGNPDVDNVGSTAVNDNTWHHIAATYNHTTGQLYLYVDGIQDYAETESAVAIDSETGLELNIGRHQGSAQYFNGAIDDVRFYNRALSSTEITALHQESLQGYPNLLNRVSSKSYYFFDAGGGSSVSPPATLTATAIAQTTKKTAPTATATGTATATTPTARKIAQTPAATLTLSAVAKTTAKTTETPFATATFTATAGAYLSATLTPPATLTVSAEAMTTAKTASIPAAESTLTATIATGAKQEAVPSATATFTGTAATASKSATLEAAEIVFTATTFETTKTATTPAATATLTAQSMATSLDTLIVLISTRLKARRFSTQLQPRAFSQRLHARRFTTRASARN